MQRLFWISAAIAFGVGFYGASIYAETQKPEVKKQVTESERIAQKRRREAECREQKIPLNRCFAKTKEEPTPTPTPAATAVQTPEATSTSTPEPRAGKADELFDLEPEPGMQ